MQWIRQIDQTMFFWCNQRLSSRAMDRLFGWITHLGGALFTIICAVSLAWFAEGEFSRIGLQSLIALAVSHIIAVLIKRKVRRDRPFRKLEQVKVGKFPLKDYSFPSGHTTAIFALVTPFMLASSPAIMLVLIGLALLVAISRVYWGYHYPIDCVAGGMVGFLTAVLVVLFMHS
ncbi:phosphatase PAP2 family protein [Paenibacillus sp. FSL L8-0158]|uniref:phosphatase PAP2 family protein n=1 Tax=Paenibacillus sp. FSL L8-0158 TaxID=2954752 RepID=UPI0031591BC4